jgi:hypothetical protein
MGNIISLQNSTDAFTESNCFIFTMHVHSIAITLKSYKVLAELAHASVSMQLLFCVLPSEKRKINTKHLPRRITLITLNIPVAILRGRNKQITIVRKVLFAEIMSMLK